MLNKYKKVSLGKLLYYGAWILFSTIYILYQQSEFIYYAHAASIYKMGSYLTIFMLCCCIFVDSRYRIKEFYIYAFFLALIGLIYLNRSNRTFLVYMFFILAFKTVKNDFRRLVLFDLKVKLMLLIFVLLMCCVGVIDDYSSVWGSGIIKHAYGFYHPNTLGILCFAILVEWLYLRYEKMKITEWILIFVIAYLMYRIAASRTATYTFSIILVMFFVAQRWSRFFELKISKAILILLTAIFAGISWWILFLYIKGNTIAQAINSLTTQRLRYAANFYAEYGISVFGKNIEFVSSRAAQLQGISSEILDMAYVRGPILFGIIFSAIVFIGYMILVKKCLDNDGGIRGMNIGLALFVTYYVILGLGENYLLNPVYCVPMILIPSAFVGIRKKNTSTNNK